MRDGHPGRLRIASYNILGGRGTDCLRDTGRIAGVLRRIDADVIALQEVDRGTRRMHGRDVSRELASALAMSQRFGAAMPFNGGEYGVSLLSRVPLKEASIIRLPGRFGAEPRIALSALVTPPGCSSPVRIVSTHLDCGFGCRLRTAQARELAKQLAADPRPCVLVGDFNAGPESPCLREFGGDWVRISGRKPHTWPSRRPRRALDHILLRPEAAWRVEVVRRGDEFAPADKEWISLLRKTSDHLPIVADLALVETDSPENIP